MNALVIDVLMTYSASGERILVCFACSDVRFTTDTTSGVKPRLERYKRHYATSDVSPLAIEVL